MKFEVIGPDGQCKMSTTYEEYIPYTYLDQMHKSGYKFRIDGKFVSLSAVKNGKKVKIQCEETGEVFDNQSQAAKYFHIDPAQVSDSIRTGRPRSGYTFVKV